MTTHVRCKALAFAAFAAVMILGGADVHVVAEQAAGGRAAQATPQQEAQRKAQEAQARQRAVQQRAQEVRHQAEAKPAATGSANAEAAPGEDKQDEKDDAADGADKKKPRPIKLKVTPLSVRLSYSTRFNDKGKKENENKSGSISLECHYPADLKATSYKFLSARMKTAMGDKVDVDVNSNYEHHLSPPNQNGKGGSFNLSMSLPDAVWGARKIARIDGVVQFTKAEGPLRLAVLKPFKKLLGKTIKIKEYPNARINIERKGDNRLRITFHGDSKTSKLLQHTRFTTARGAEIDSDSWGTGSSGGTSYRRYRVTMPDDGRIVLTFWHGFKTIKVPFTARDVPLPDVRRGRDRFDLVFHTRPVGEGGAGGKPRQGDLHVTTN